MKSGARTVILLFGDIVSLVAAFWVMLSISFYGKLDESIVHIHGLPFSIMGVTWIIIFFIFNLYDTQATRPTIPHLRQIFTAFIVAFAVGITFFYTIPFFGITPKTNLSIFAIIALAIFIFWRRVFYKIFASYFKKEVVFITSEKETESQVNDLKNYITKYPQSGFVVVGTYKNLEEFSKNSNSSIPQVFIVSKEVWRDRENFKTLYSIKSEVLDLAYAYEDLLGRIPIEAIDEGWFMHNVRSREKRAYDTEKRISSIIVAFLILIITSPFTLIIALLIKLYDGGPILYSQTRRGKGGEDFILYKFRSMVVNAEKNGPEWSKSGDPRRTPIGKVIRKLHIDEIPQMLNIIKGDITLVGPRPERPEFVDELRKQIPFYYLRHIISPGFTGWAQIKFRYAGNVMDSKEKFEYDLYYLKNRNVFMDIGIILRTIQIIFTH